MTRYALIDNGSGLVWGVVDADTPIEACRKVDEDFGEHGREYHEVGWHLDLNDTGYQVFEVPAGFDVHDGGSQTAINAVEDHDIVAHVRVIPTRDE